MNVRMKNPDSNARASFITRFDDTGAALVDITMVELAKSHGWYVAHIEHEPKEEPVEPEKTEVPEPATTDTAQEPPPPLPNPPQRRERLRPKG